MGKIVRTTPQRWLSKGESAVPDKRQPLVLWGGIVGEQADFRIVHTGQNQIRAIFDDTQTPSPHRVHPSCEKFDACGGCPMMHMDAEGQKLAHIQRTRLALDDAGLRDVKIEGWTPCPTPRDFRYVVKLGWGYTADKKRIKIGAFGRRDKRIVPIPQCEVAAPVLRGVMASLAHHSLALNIEPYDPETDRGVMRAAVIRASSTNDEVVLTLIAGRRPAELDELVERISQENSCLVGIWLHRNTQPGNALFHTEPDGSIGMRHLAGRDYLEEDLDGISVQVGPGDFYQTNPSVALPLYKRALDRLELGPTDALVDLYSGVGGLTLLGARRCQHAIGIEQVAGAVVRAKDAARRNQIRAEFIQGDVVDILPLVAKRLQHPLVSVDPSRRGLQPEVVDQLIAMQPRRLVYVSCSARSLARDLAKFRAGGATLEHVELFDMFPNTAHVECLTTLSFPVESGRSPRRKLVRS